MRISRSEALEELGVEDGASDADLKKAFRALALQHQCGGWLGRAGEGVEWVPSSADPGQITIVGVR